MTFVVKQLVRVGIVLACSSGVAYAQDRTLRFDEVDIVGKIQKPEIQILITRQNLNPPYALVLRESFLPKIVLSVRKRPF